MRLERQELAEEECVASRRRASSSGAHMSSPDPTLPRLVNPALTPVDRSLLTEFSEGGDKEASRKRPTPATRKEKDTVDHLTQAIVMQNKEVKKYRAAADKPLIVQVVDRLGSVTTKL